MNKKLLLFIPLISGLVTGCGCSPEFREDLKDFIYPISYDSAYNHVKIAQLSATRIAKSKETNEILGEEEVSFFFDRSDENNLEYHLYNSRTGILKTNEDDPTLVDTKIYKEGDIYKLEETKDQEHSLKDTSKEYCISKLTKFFYANENGMMKTRGMYYGDELKQMTRMQNFLEVDKTKNILKIEVNDLDLEGVNTCYKLFIDSFGMLLNGTYDMKDDEKQLLIDVTCTYNDNVKSKGDIR